MSISATNAYFLSHYYHGDVTQSHHLPYSDANQKKTIILLLLFHFVGMKRKSEQVLNLCRLKDLLH